MSINKLEPKVNRYSRISKKIVKFWWDSAVQPRGVAGVNGDPPRSCWRWWRSDGRQWGRDSLQWQSDRAGGANQRLTVAGALTGDDYWRKWHWWRNPRRRRRRWTGGLSAHSKAFFNIYISFSFLNLHKSTQINSIHSEILNLQIKFKLQNSLSNFL